MALSQYNSHRLDLNMASREVDKLLEISAMAERGSPFDKLLADKNQLVQQIQAMDSYKMYKYSQYPYTGIGSIPSTTESSRRSSSSSVFGSESSNSPLNQPDVASDVEMTEGSQETKDGSSDSFSNSDSSSEQKAEDKNYNCGVTESCSAVLEPSKDESRRSDGRPKNLLRKLSTGSCPGASTSYVSLSSSDTSSDHEDEQQNSEHQSSIDQQNSEHQSSVDQQVDEPRANCCASCIHSYKIYARKIGISWFIYIFQIFVSLLCISSIVMGIIFFRSCSDQKPSPISAVLIMLMGISGLIVTSSWFIKVRRQRRGQYYWNCERHRLSMYFATFLTFWIMELAVFFATSPKTLQSNIGYKCIKAFYDYMYCMNIAIGGSFVLAASLYFPDCIIYMLTNENSVPSPANGHYQPL